MKTLGIIGGGHLGQQLAYHALNGQFDAVVFFDDTQEKGTKNKFGVVIGGISEIEKTYQNQGFERCRWAAAG